MHESALATRSVSPYPSGSRPTPSPGHAVPRPALTPAPAQFAADQGERTRSCLQTQKSPSRRPRQLTLFPPGFGWIQKAACERRAPERRPRAKAADGGSPGTWGATTHGPALDDRGLRHPGRTLKDGATGYVPEGPGSLGPAPPGQAGTSPPGDRGERPGRGLRAPGRRDTPWPSPGPPGTRPVGEGPGGPCPVLPGSTASAALTPRAQEDARFSHLPPQGLGHFPRVSNKRPSGFP